MSDFFTGAKAPCAYCFKLYALNNDGTVRSHGSTGTACSRGGSQPYDFAETREERKGLLAEIGRACRAHVEGDIEHYNASDCARGCFTELAAEAVIEFVGCAPQTDAHGARAIYREILRKAIDRV